MMHFDEARRQATEALRKLVEAEPSVERAVVIDDIFGKIRAVVWLKEHPETLRGTIEAALSEAAGQFWSGDLWIPSGSEDPQNPVYETAWRQGVEISTKLRRADRHRSKGFWLSPPTEPVWIEPRPPVVSFYSFKGGVGRTTGLAAFAIQRARLGERVVVLDLDMEAPGVGTLLDAGEGVGGARWGVLDYLLERPLLHTSPDLRDYYHACAREAVSGRGEILVFPASSLDGDFLSKLSRVDLEPAPAGNGHPLILLLEQIRAELNPHWLLIDSRAGLSEASGFALSGLAHLNVLFGTTSEQSWLGLRLVLQRLGAERVQQNRLQLDCILVQAMVPEGPSRNVAEAAFRERADDEFRDQYYAEDPSDPEEDRYWYVRDMPSEDAPHVPVPLPYKTNLAFLGRIDDVAADLASDPSYSALSERIAGRFAERTSLEDEL